MKMRKVFQIVLLVVLFAALSVSLANASGRDLLTDGGGPYNDHPSPGPGAPWSHPKGPTAIGGPYQDHPSPGCGAPYNEQWDDIEYIYPCYEHPGPVTYGNGSDGPPGWSHENPGKGGTGNGPVAYGNGSDGPPGWSHENPGKGGTGNGPLAFGGPYDDHPSPGNGAPWSHQPKS